jgi:hypothetical protein
MGIEYGEEELLARHAEHELLPLDPEENELRAAGEICARCGVVITATQDVWRRPDGRFVHEVCPEVTSRTAED